MDDPSLSAKWEGFNKFFCKGRIMTGPKPLAAILLFTGINIAAILTFAFPFLFYAIEGNPVVMLFGLVLHISIDAFMCLTCLTDPGIVPM